MNHQVWRQECVVIDKGCMECRLLELRGRIAVGGVM